jgi:DNA-binding GntR family transcriptional regulator
MATGTRMSARLDQLSQNLRRAPMADQIAESIRGMILAGELNPGERIVESRIARQIGVGQPTVREALVALEHQGLVIRKANQGCEVTTLTLAEISQILRIRGELESLAVEMAIENASDSEIGGLAALAAKMQRAGRAHKVEEFFELDIRFHDVLWRLSGSALLPRLLSQALIPLLAFLFIRNARDRARIDLRESADAHAEIAEAILGRDKQAARRVVREKFQLFAEQHLRWFEEGARP